MTRATTAKFSEFVLEVEFDPTGSPGTYTRVCGLTSRGIDRKHNMQTSEVPDCDDEDLPSAVERSVQSSEVTISGSGVWSQQSHEKLLDWWYAGTTLNVRIQHVNAASGDTEYEGGAAYLVTIGNRGEKGPKVGTELSLEFDGVPTRTAKA